MALRSQTNPLRRLLEAKTFLHMPSVYDALTARLAQSLGYEALELGVRHQRMTPDQFGQFVRSENVKYKEIGRRTGVKMEQ